jgi:hypothetical protein
MVYDPGKLDKATKVSLEVNGKKKVMPFPFAFTKCRTGGGGNGRYSVAAWLS